MTRSSYTKIISSTFFSLWIACMAFGIEFLFKFLLLLCNLCCKVYINQIKYIIESKQVSHVIGITFFLLLSM